MFIGSSNENGICVISYQSPNGKAPDVIVATPGPWSSDDMRGLAITIWEKWCERSTNAIDEHPYWRVRHKMAYKILMGCDMELAFPNPAFHDMEGPLQQQQYFADARG